MARQSDIDAGDQYHPRAGHRCGRASRMASGRRATGGSELAVAFATELIDISNNKDLSWQPRPKAIVAFKRLIPALATRGGADPPVDWQNASEAAEARE
jgi:hypothetical protein